MLAMTRCFTPTQTHGVNTRRFEVEDFARDWAWEVAFPSTGPPLGVGPIPARKLICIPHPGNHPLSIVSEVHPPATPFTPRQTRAGGHDDSWNHYGARYVKTGSPHLANEVS